jgi:DNA-binding NarL/FixJ family response regulator
MSITSYTIKVTASNTKIACEVALDLASREFELRPDAPYEVLIDQPVGYALLTDMENNKNFIVATDNTCPEYLIDLQQKGVAAIVPLSPYTTLYQEIRRVLKGEYVPEVYTSHLTPTERFTLQCVAKWIRKIILTVEPV